MLLQSFATGWSESTDRYSRGEGAKCRVARNPQASMHVLPPHSPALLPPDWRGLTKSAKIEEQLVGHTLDYLACWTSEEPALLPIQCRRRRKRDRQDLSQWAYQLTS